jgi:S1-C subfamily serine protease
MRNLILLGVLILATGLTLPAHAGWSVQMHGTRDSLTWRANNGQALNLASPYGKGIEVVDIEPAGRDGLQQGDVITAVDNQVVARVVDLLTYSNAHPNDATRLTLHRGHGEQELVVGAGKLNALLHPHP